VASQEEAAGLFDVLLIREDGGSATKFVQKVTWKDLVPLAAFKE
jgi:hypothetical protein